MAWAEINGVRMFYESHGEGDAIVFAHGAGGNHLSWWQQVGQFMRSYRCVTFDHRGFGQTVDVPGGPGMAAYPDDLRALMDNLEIPRAALVAQSMGGTACLGFTVAHPDRVRALVMADTIGTVSDPSIRERLQALRGEGRREAPGGGAERGFTLQGRAYHPSLRERRPDLAVLYDSIMATNPPRESLVPGTRRVDERYVATRERLAAIVVPVLFLVGDEDAILPPDIVAEVAAMVPGSRLERVAGCGHSVYFEDAPAFNRIVGTFLASV